MQKFCYSKVETAITRWGAIDKNDQFKEYHNYFAFWGHQ